MGLDAGKFVLLGWKMYGEFGIVRDCGGFRENLKDS
jgi:hypothetical protein